MTETNYILIARDPNGKILFGDDLPDDTLYSVMTREQFNFVLSEITYRHWEGQRFKPLPNDDDHVQWSRELLGKGAPRWLVVGLAHYMKGGDGKATPEDVR